MSESITDFWRLMGPNQTVHPLDQPLLNSAHHSIKTNEPPPAFIGDIDRAPVVVLCSNGGWNPETHREFLHPENAPTKYVARLHESTPCDPAIISPYYAKSNIAKWILSGDIALLNLIPYRSVELNHEPENKRFADVLPSSRCAVEWVNKVAMPLVSNKLKMVITKREIWFKHIEPKWRPYLVDTQRRGPHVFRDTLSGISEFLTSLGR